MSKNNQTTTKSHCWLKQLKNIFYVKEQSNHNAIDYNFDSILISSMSKNNQTTTRQPFRKLHFLISSMSKNNQTTTTAYKDFADTKISSMSKNNQTTTDLIEIYLVV